MISIELDNLSEEQQIVVASLVREGMLTAYDKVISVFVKEFNDTATEDPHFSYYVKHVIEVVQELAEEAKSI
jgi:hypothetical protein